MKQTLKIIFASALATAAVIKAVPALAEPVQNISIVRTADLDLSTRAGRDQLSHRLVIAAHEVCGSASDADLAGKNKVRQCRHDVLAEAGAKAQSLAAGEPRERTILIAASR